MQVPSLSLEDPLQKEMATRASVHAWRIPWTEGPGGLQTMGLHRVSRHTCILLLAVCPCLGNLTPICLSFLSVGWILPDTLL